MRARIHNFGRGLLDFLAELKANKDREWFDSNKQRYVDQVEKPMLSFINVLGDRMEKSAKKLHRARSRSVRSAPRDSSTRSWRPAPERRRWSNSSPRRSGSGGRVAKP